MMIMMIKSKYTQARTFSKEWNFKKCALKSELHDHHFVASEADRLTYAKPNKRKKNIYMC
jgi:hypothetical protein